ncbi:MAG: SCO family protein [Nitrosopumilus sp.]
MMKSTRKKIIVASLIIPIIILGFFLLNSEINNSTQDSDSRFVRPTDYTPAIVLEGKVAPDFTLVDQDGQEFTLSESSDKISLIYFGYTNCPDVCPLVLANFAAVARALGSDSDRIQMLMITTDPQRDTSEVLGNYVELFDSRIKGLTGNKEQLDSVWAAYNVPFEYVRIGNGTDYLVAHFSLVLVVDKDQVLRFAFTPEMSKDEYIQGVKSLL